MLDNEYFEVGNNRDGYTRYNRREFDAREVAFRMLGPSPTQCEFLERLDRQFAYPGALTALHRIRAYGAILDLLEEENFHSPCCELIMA